MKRKSTFIAIIFIALVLAPIALNKYYNYLLRPASTQKTEQIFVVKPGETVPEIAADLKEAGLIKNPFAFKLLVSQMGIAKTIQFGDFRLDPTMSSKEIATLLTHGAIDVWVTFPEGIRIEEQAQIVEEKLKFGQIENYNFDKREYIKEAEEGYMFPDTYLIARDAAAVDVAKKLRDTFTSKVEDQYLNKNTTKLTNKQIVIFASLLEREAKGDGQRAKIAGVIVNRLEAGMSLDIDATVQYAKGYDSATNKWWPQITVEDYKSVRSVYNTYLNPGLPPEPICSPGIASIKAALNPEKNNYYYYLHDSEGVIHFATTVEEHNENIRNFL